MEIEGERMTVDGKVGKEWAIVLEIHIKGGFTRKVLYLLGTE